jgi:hypothetical protein
MNSTEKAQQQEAESAEEFEIVEETEVEAKQADAQDQDDGDDSEDDERLSDSRTLEEDARRDASVGNKTRSLPATRRGRKCSG